MIKNLINLNIGGLNCSISTPNSFWRNFLRKKYKDFLIKENVGRFHLYFNLHPSKKEKVFQLKIKAVNFNSASLYCPDDMGLFKLVDFFFKKFYGYILSQNKGFLLHASALCEGGRSYIFSGKARAGKSTIHKLLPQYKILADDTTIIKSINKRYYVFGSPFYDTNKPNSGNIHVPIAGLYFLKKSNKNEIKKIEIEEVVKRLIINIYTCKFSERMNTILLINLWETCYDFAKKVPAYLLSFKKDPSFWQMIRSKHD